MTKDEIKKMEAGREMDALIAINIMGRKLNKSSDILFVNAVKDETIPHYSTNMGCAMEVVDSFSGDAARVSKGYGVLGNYYFVRIGNSEEIGNRSLPLAVCRAALLSVMK